MELFMKGQTAIVTGASQGIGRAITRALALEGVQVMAVARNRELLDGLKADISAAGGVPPITLIAELTHAGSSALIAERALAELGQVNILVNNAGRSQPLDVVGLDDKWQESFILEFERPRQLTQVLLPHFMERKQGVVLNVISTFELKSINASAVAKTALTAWSKQLSAQVGRYNVRVNCLQPGLIDTENTRRMFTPQQRKDFAEANIALGDFGEPEDMADTAVFLVSPRARYVTGAVWNVDGGLRYYPF
jgi:Dehydrogenases with different specificities (related to short-chain alcohol dehydrogenases)